MNVGDRYINNRTHQTVEIVAIKDTIVFFSEPGRHSEEMMSKDRFLIHYTPAETAGIDYWRGRYE